jgi:hypothetical protein
MFYSQPRVNLKYRKRDADDPVAMMDMSDLPELNK